MKILKGISVASGIAIARPFVLEAEGRAVPLRQTITDAELEREIKGFREALQKAGESIKLSRERLEATLGKGHGAVFDAHMLILKDPLLVDTEDPMLMIAPAPARRIEGTTALMPRNAPVSAVSMMMCHISSVWSSNGTRKLAPALLHRTVTGPNAFSTSDTAAAHWPASRTSR